MNWPDDSNDVTDDKPRIGEARWWRSWLPSLVSLRDAVTDPWTVGSIVGIAVCMLGIYLVLGWYVGRAVLVALATATAVAFVTALKIKGYTYDFRVELLKSFVASLSLLFSFLLAMIGAWVWLREVGWVLFFFPPVWVVILIPTAFVIKMLWREFSAREVIGVEVGMVLGSVFGLWLAIWLL